MQLSFTIKDKWKLCTIATIFCCLILIIFLNQSNKNVSFSNNMLPLAPLLESQAPLSSIVAQLPRPSCPPPSATSVITKNLDPFNFTSISTTVEQQPNTTLLSQRDKLNVSVYNLKKPIIMKTNIAGQECDMFDGRWVYKPKEKPKYNSIKCPFIEEKMNCRKNGRPDFEYEKWRWEARDCKIPL